MAQRKTREPWDTSAVRTFSKLARDYIEFIDRVDALSRDELIDGSYSLLSRLHTVGLELPDVSARGLRDEDAEPQWSVKAHFALMNKIDSLLGDHSSFHVVFNPYEEDEPVVVSVGDCLADIYWGLKKGLQLFEENESRKRRAGVWEWHFGIEDYGYHILEVLHAFYWLKTRHLGSE